MEYSHKKMKYGDDEKKTGHKYSSQDHKKMMAKTAAKKKQAKAKKGLVKR
jgi:hypothetical protein